MEPIIFIIGIIGFATACYYLYLAQPSTKYKKATELIAKKEYENGRAILRLLFGKFPKAPAKFAESYTIEGIEQIDKKIARGIFQKVLEIKNEIPDEISSQDYFQFEAKAIYEIAKIDLENAKSERNATEIISQVSRSLDFLLTAPTDNISEPFASLKNDHFHELAKAYKKIGKEAEGRGRIVEALSKYSTALQYSNGKSDLALESEISVRIAICNLKLNNQFNREVFNKVGRLESKVRQDFYFRFAKRLAIDGNYEESEKVLKANLDSSNIEVAKLVTYLHEKKVHFAVTEIEQLNDVISKKDAYSTQELINIYGDFDKKLRLITDVIPSLSEKVKQIKPILFKRLLADYIDKKLFVDGLNIIKKYPNFWSNTDYLRNAAICCYHIALNGLLTKSNYKEVISIWLTSVFCNDIIIKSLEETNWHDEYTFTLHGTLGTIAFKAKLSNNINNSVPTEKNISIGDTQQELINKFEGVINQILDVAFQNEIVNFYSKEKETIQKTIRIIDKDIFITTPHFALTNNIFREIVNAIDDKYIITDNESTLEIGVQYIRVPDETIVGNYLSATQVIENFLRNLDDENLPGLKVTNTKDNRKLLSGFPKLYNSIEDKIQQRIESRITQNEHNESLIPLMEEAINFSKSNDKLKFQYCNFVTNYCIDKVNAEEIQNYKALLLLSNAYFVSPKHRKLCTNLITLIHFNLRDIRNEEVANISSIYSLLDRIYENKSSVFKEISHELVEIRERLLSQLEQSGIPRNLFTGQSNGNLNSSGLELKKVLQYYKKLGEN